jgi:hypothetical protein
MAWRWIWLLFLVVCVVLFGADAWTDVRRLHEIRSQWTPASAQVIDRSIGVTDRQSHGNGSPSTTRSYTLMLRLRYRFAERDYDVWAFGPFSHPVRQIVGIEQSLYQVGDSVPVRLSPADARSVSLVGDWSARSVFHVLYLAVVETLLLAAMTATYCLMIRNRQS